MADDPLTALEEIRERMSEATFLTPALLAAIGMQDAPRLLAALDVALKFHQPRQLHEMAFDPRGNPRCGHDPGTDPDAHYEGDDGVWYCKSLPSAVACSGCPESPDGEYADWPCPEYSAILAALTGKEEQ